jgi:hypothetical protein
MLRLMPVSLLAPLHLLAAPAAALPVFAPAVAKAVVRLVSLVPC